MPRNNDDGEPAPQVNLAGTLPPAAKNGLLDIVPDLLDRPKVRRIAVIEFDVLYTKRDVDNRPDTPIIRLWQVEPVDGDMALEAARIMDKAEAMRTGQGAVMGAGSGQ